VVPSAVASAAFSPLYGKKKGVGQRQTLSGDARRQILHAARFGPLQGIALKAQKKNGSGRGRMRAGAGSHDEQRTLQFTPKICGGRFLGICAYIGCILQQHDESAGCG
jgi:hypothetical protein